jgi:hypothetical protein
MTKVKFINEYYFFEYQTSRGVPQRFHYYLQAAFYPFKAAMPGGNSGQRFVPEKTVFSSDFIPERAFSQRFLR